MFRKEFDRNQLNYRFKKTVKITQLEIAIKLRELCCSLLTSLKTLAQVTTFFEILFSEKGRRFRYFAET